MSTRLALLPGLAAFMALLWMLSPAQPIPAQTQNTCQGAFTSVSPALTDLGMNEYVRLNDGPTGYSGGLYPGGVNVRPAQHEADGLAVAAQIEPLNGNGQPDVNGRVVMISVGMSNAAMEFGDFIELARYDPLRNQALRIINGAYSGRTAEQWLDPDADTWAYVDQQIIDFGLTPEQVQVAWVKNVRTGGGEFPEKAEQLQEDLATIVRNLKINYPNIKIAYLSSRTRSYTYWNGLSPEPAAFESGFAVKWLIEEQIEGDSALNFDSHNGAVVAPFLSWGPYLWADGMNARSDGFVWLPEDMGPDCTHPSHSGRQKIANLLLEFFHADSTAQSWYLDDSLPPPTPPPTPVDTIYLPHINKPPSSNLR